MKKPEVIRLKEVKNAGNIATAYEDIALSWYNHHYHSRFTHQLEALARRWKQGRLLNIGSGHGPDFQPFKTGFELYGLDLSSAMVNILKKHTAKMGLNVEAINGDAVEIPFASYSFDWALAVAVYHCIKEESGRLEALRELYRVLKPGGEAFITVWNRWQRQFFFKGKDVLIPWRLKDKVVYRYYYLFSQAEITGIARKAGFTVTTLTEEKRHRIPVIDGRKNICLLLKKVS